MRFQDVQSSSPHWRGKDNVLPGAELRLKLGRLALIYSPFRWGSLTWPEMGEFDRPTGFIYVDLYINEEQLFNEINTFTGYKVLFIKKITNQQLGIESIRPYLISEDDQNCWDRENPLVYRYAYWLVYERLDGYDENHGSKRFSLLYIGGEGVSSYKSLYKRNKLSPLGIGLIRSDGFTGNWTEFCCDNSVLAKLVKNNEFGMPKYLISERTNEGGNAPWPWFAHKIASLPTRSTGEADSFREKLHLWHSESDALEDQI